MSISEICPQEAAKTRHLIAYMAGKQYPHTIDKVLKAETAGPIENYFVHVADQPHAPVAALPPGFNNIARYNPALRAWGLALEW